MDISPFIAVDPGLENALTGAGSVTGRLAPASATVHNPSDSSLESEASATMDQGRSPKLSRLTRAGDATGSGPPLGQSPRGYCADRGGGLRWVPCLSLVDTPDPDGRQPRHQDLSLHGPTHDLVVPVEQTPPWPCRDRDLSRYPRPRAERQHRTGHLDSGDLPHRRGDSGGRLCAAPE